MRIFLYSLPTLFSLSFFFSTSLHARTQTIPPTPAPFETRDNTERLEDVVVTASKQSESYFNAPVSIEQMGVKEIRQATQLNFFDEIQNMKSVQVITPSLGFKVINARGFATTTNVRFVQMVDGMDMQAPHIGAPIANSLGPSDLDILKVEILPGASSAMYSMNAINGIANFITKDPFAYQGVSVEQKSGVNNIASDYTKPTYYNETSLRVAKAWNDRWAFKVNATYMHGTDWYANNLTDLRPNVNSSTGLIGKDNVGADFVNIYGDERANSRTLTLGGRQYVVSRTGYAEKDMTSYELRNIKADAGLYFRPKKGMEVNYTYHIANQNNVYQRTNRFRLANYMTQQHGVSFHSESIQVRAFVTLENTGQSYNIRSMAENMDRSFKTDNQWFSDFQNAFNTNTSGTIIERMNAARASADAGRPVAHTQETDAKMKELSNINNWDRGAALRVRARLYHAEFQHNITTKLLPRLARDFHLDLMYGFDFRNYNITPDGNYFVNPVHSGRNLNYYKVGGFVQATKLFFNQKLKVNAVIRLDKAQYFQTPVVNPRLAVVYTPTKQHSLRASIQHGYRFPSIFEGFSNINSGGRRRVGGLRVMSDGVFENSYTQASITQFQSAVTADVNRGISQADAIKSHENMLKKNPYTYLKPEEVTSFEMGYRAQLLNKKLHIDADFYYNIYRNLMAQIDANIPMAGPTDSLGAFMNQTSKQSRYRLWTNSSTISHNVGASLGVSYELPKHFFVSVNGTFAKLIRRDKNDGLEDAFNTPEWVYNVSFGNRNIYKTLGFNIHFRQQAAYLWQSALATGRVASYYNLDVQMQMEVIKKYLRVKVGGTNVTNKYYYSFIGGPSIGAMYYVDLVFDFPHW